MRVRAMMCTLGIAFLVITMSNVFVSKGSNSVETKLLWERNFPTITVGAYDNYVIIQDANKNNNSRDIRIIDVYTGKQRHLISSKSFINSIITQTNKKTINKYIVVPNGECNETVLNCYKIPEIIKVWNTEKEYNILCWHENNMIYHISDELVFCESQWLSNNSGYSTNAIIISLEDGETINNTEIIRDRGFNDFSTKTHSLSLFDSNSKYKIFRNWKNLTKGSIGQTAMHLSVYDKDYNFISSLPDIEYKGVDDVFSGVAELNDNAYDNCLWNNHVIYPYSHINNVDKESIIDIIAHNIVSNNNIVIHSLREGMYLSYIHIYNDILYFGVQVGKQHKMYSFDLETFSFISKETSKYNFCVSEGYYFIENLLYCGVEDENESYHLACINLDTMEKKILSILDKKVDSIFVENNLLIYSDTDKTYCLKYEPIYHTDSIKYHSLKFKIDEKAYILDNKSIEMDCQPVIIDSRALLPAIYVVEPLGGQVFWDGEQRKVTCKLAAPGNHKTDEYKENIVELWIDKPTARVNGVEVQIDPDNPDVVPTIINDRTMVPMRFLAESLGCEVEWVADTKEIILTYTP